MEDPPNIDDLKLPPIDQQATNRTFRENLRIPLALGFTKQREWVRTIIALTLLGVVVCLAVGMFFAFIGHSLSQDGLKALVAALFTPILGVFGTVTGFYYGTHAANNDGRDGKE